MSTLFENYDLFLRDNASSFSGPSDGVRLLSDEMMFSSYKDSLTEHLDPSARKSVGNILERERRLLLENFSNSGPSGLANGWVVSSFPILVD